nr:MAG TPA: hypothetical protein [Caudoviricetes sp.]
MITWADASGPVTGEPGDPAHGSCRVTQYHDMDTGALMYRVEKESSEPDSAAELIAIHVSGRYGKDLLAYMKQELGGDLKAGGAMLLVMPDTPPQEPLPPETRAGFPSPLRPTRHNLDGSPDWGGGAVTEVDTGVADGPITLPEEVITLPEGTLEDATGELF